MMNYRFSIAEVQEPVSCMRQNKRHGSNTEFYSALEERMAVSWRFSMTSFYFHSQNARKGRWHAQCVTQNDFKFRLNVGDIRAAVWMTVTTQSSKHGATTLPVCISDVWLHLYECLLLRDV